jgi:hypothetical protein
MKTYTTAAEHRAHINGAGEVIKAIQERIGPLWLLGRDGMDLESLRDLLLGIATESGGHHLRAAQALEAAATATTEEP